MGILKITPQAEIDTYFESTALSQSSLKKLLGGIGPYLAVGKEDKSLYYEEKGSFIIGSAVDMILTGEEGEFKKKYHISNLDKKPSDAEMSIMNMFFDDVLKLNPDGKLGTINDYPGSLDYAIKSSEWYGGAPGEKRTIGLISRCEPYFADLKASIGKQILSASEDKLIKDIVLSLKSNSVTGPYFNRREILNDPYNKTVYTQLPIYFNYRGVYCKALLDMLIVVKDENDKVKLVIPIDLKTMMGSTLKFLSSVKSWRYDIQAAWYTEALLSDNSSFELEGQITKENIQGFTFIVESNTYPGQPLIYQMEQDMLDIGKHGLKELSVSTPNHSFPQIVKQATLGFEDLLDIFIYQEANDWKEEKVITDNKGILKLSWNGIKINK